MFVHLGYHCPARAACRKTCCRGEDRMSGQLQLPRHHDDLDRRPTLMHGMASPRPSMLPGIWMSVHISAMSDLDSRMATASSASRASTGEYRRLPPYRPRACAAYSSSTMRTNAAIRCPWMGVHGKQRSTWDRRSMQGQVSRCPYDPCQGALFLNTAADPPAAPPGSPRPPRW